MIKEIKPLPKFKWLLFLQTAVVWIFIAMFLMMFFAPFMFLIIPLGIIATAALGGGLGAIVGVLLGLIGIIAAFLVALVVPYIVASMRYEKEYYWITDRRVVQKSGFIGYTVYSIPFERISDAIITRTFIESLFGFGGVQIQSLAGQYSGYPKSGFGSFGAEGRLQALNNPEVIQELIFKLVRENRKTQKLGI